MATDMMMLDLVNEIGEFFQDAPRASTWERIVRSKLDTLRTMLQEQVDSYDAYIDRIAPDPDALADAVSAHWGHD